MLASLRAAVTRFSRNDEGATLVEYALLVALIAVVCIGAVTLIGANVSANLTTAAKAIPSSQ